MIQKDKSEMRALEKQLHFTKDLELLKVSFSVFGRIVSAFS